MYSKMVTRYLILMFILFGTSSLWAQAKLAQSGFQFLSVSQDARAAAMGSAFTTVEGTPNAIFYNPAGLANMNEQFGVAVNYFNFIADIRHASLALSYAPANGEYGVFSFSVQSVDYGDLEGTQVWPNEQGFVETGVFNPQALAIGLGYSRSLTNRFLVGGQIKLVGQTLGSSALPTGVTKENVANVVAFDFGTIYKTGFKSLAFGMSVRNFSQEIKFEEEGFQLPLTFRIGLSIDAMDFLMPDQDTHKLLVTFDAAHPRSFAEYVNFGTEYIFMNTFILRLGYISGHTEYNYSLGFGVQKFGLHINYAYQPFGVFGSVNRFSVNFMF
ncbi:MAG TPA: PorV/PorQ family protein [Caldithrix abyssi]|uniref:PorV/PorQ family protein n=1 Tax=Caldithrix abyssi TaxID=187145 RepID=A0A7V4U2P5_CALAY|nr:PorV/PorQ family protein [Caldithrix abyssi]